MRRGPRTPRRGVPGHVPRPDRRARQRRAETGRRPRCGCARDTFVLHRHRPSARRATPAWWTISCCAAVTGCPPTTWPSWSTMPPQASTRWCAGTTCCRRRRGRPISRRCWATRSRPTPTYRWCSTTDGKRLAKRDGAVTLADIGVRAGAAPHRGSLGYAEHGISTACSPSSTRQLLPCEPVGIPASREREPCRGGPTVATVRRCSDTCGGLSLAVLLRRCGDPRCRRLAVRPGTGTPTRSSRPACCGSAPRASTHRSAITTPRPVNSSATTSTSPRRSVRSWASSVEFVETPWDSIFARAGGRPVRHRRQPGHHQPPNAQGKYDLSQPYTVGEGVIVTRANDDSDQVAGRRQGQDRSGERHQQLVGGGPQRRAPRSSPWRASPRPSRCSTRAASTSSSMTASPSTPTSPRPGDKSSRSRPPSARRASRASRLARTAAICPNSTGR